MEIVVLTIGAKSGISGLREFCFLSALLLAYDFIAMFTWYTAILTLKLEVNIRFKKIIRNLNASFHFFLFLFSLLLIYKNIIRFLFVQLTRIRAINGSSATVAKKGGAVKNTGYVRRTVVKVLDVSDNEDGKTDNFIIGRLKLLMVWIPILFYLLFLLSKRDHYNCLTFSLTEFDHISL